MKHTFLFFLVIALLAPAARAQPVPAKLWRGEVFITLTKDTTLVWSLDTAGLRSFLQDVIDSTVAADSMLAAAPPVTLTSQGRVRIVGLHPDTAIAYRNGGASVDTTKLVSMNRDDAAIRGEKTFAGEVAAATRLGVGSSALPGGDPTRFYVQHDTASKRLGQAAVSITNLSSQPTWKLYESGIAEMPRQSCVRAYRSGTQALTAGLDTRIAFNSESWDAQSEFDIGTNNEFVARAGGMYLVTVTAAAHAADTNHVYLTVYKGASQNAIGGIYRSVWNGYQHYAAASVTALVQLSAGETVHARVMSNRNATLVGNAEETRFEIVKLL